MTSREYIVVTLTIVLGILAINTNARSWDLAVVIGREVQFLTRNQTPPGKAQIAEAVALAGLAYDDSTRTMYFSDTSSNVSIFSNDLTDKNFTTKPLLKRQNRNHILGIAFDIKTRTLVWSDAQKEVIMKMHVPLDRPPEEPILVHNLTNRSPRGIALDACNSHIYWVNSNNTNPSVERSNLDGSERITIVKDNLYEPLAVTVDYAEEKLYWIDDAEGIGNKIERSNLDGTERELLVHFKRQQPVSLTTDHDTIYWTDWVYRAIWTMSKNSKAGERPKEFKSYYTSYHDADPFGIIARDNTGSIDCAAFAKLKRRTNYANATSVRTTAESFNNLTTSTEESELTTESSKNCLNDGQMDENDNTCHCKPGFNGRHCEINICHNYCLQGSCNINSHGLPTCKCGDTFIGQRCETDLCKNYCLHDGQCSVQNEKPICECKYSEGSRCENLSNITKVCEIFCASTELVPININTINCRCEEANETSAQMIMIEKTDEYKMLLPFFSAFTAVLILVIIVLSYYVNKLRRRPRIRKRFVVSKGGITPLTSRPQLPDNQCEITIENCCNMNICETPCFEPKLRTTIPENNSNKKEEKNSLLDNMETNSW
ncbi:low-density lipoprotein receptor repeat domain-containing protein cueball [Ptiloglossa arizonensis]|uniref:low-density lipoprotein receptor repeat domain-containing protein cueball n=1 Tax=Ptiloglossa arizonensis TaxID=3350558 RepID=UPI003F9FB122